MKTRAIFLIMLLQGLSIFTFSQQKPTNPTKEETQQWLSEKIRQNSYVSIEGDTKHEYNLSFKDDNLLIDLRLTLIDPQGTILQHSITKVPIKLIGSFSLIEKKYNYWLTIYLKNGEEAIISQHDDLPANSKSSTNILLSNNINNENLRDRLLKAFNHLVELYTGESKKEPF